MNGVMKSQWILSCAYHLMNNSSVDMNEQRDSGTFVGHHLKYMIWQSVPRRLRVAGVQTHGSLGSSVFARLDRERHMLGTVTASLTEERSVRVEHWEVG
jgi:hypothetical protein